MITLSFTQLRRIADQHPGILRQIRHFEALDHPPCPQCESPDTALIQTGIIGRTNALAAATTRIHLTPHGIPDQTHFCHSCRSPFLSTTPH